jgi:uncharacterized protein
VLALLAGTPAVAVPPPLEQFTANCDRPSYASDQLVCADRLLSELDRQLREALAAGRFDDRIAVDALVEQQDAWFRRRSLCALSIRHAKCLRAAYLERLAVLRPIDFADPEQSVFEASCTGAPWKSVTTHVRLDGHKRATITDGKSRVLAIAFEARDGDDWSPFVRLEKRQVSLHLYPQGGSPFECRPQRPASD